MHVVTQGAFHTGMNYMGMVKSHKCSGSGYWEILIESGSVLKGKAYSKALFCLKTVSEALERLLLERLNDEERVEIINPSTLLSLVQTCEQEIPALVLQDPSTLTILERYVIFEDKVHAGLLGKTATFWLSVIAV